MFKKLTLIALVISLMEICLGSLILAGLIPASNKNPLVVAIFQISLGGVVWLVGSYTYYNAKLKHIYILTAVLVINLIFMLFSCFITIWNLLPCLFVAFLIIAFVFVLFNRIKKI